MRNITVSQIDIKTNQDGMYCLNDLHKASGDLKKDQPSNWMALPKTQELISEILKTGQTGVKTTAGRYGGTFVCMELVYSYAMWISPKFSLEVIRVFDNTAKAKSELSSLAASVRSATRSLVGQINETAVIIDELKGHGSSWGTYGSAIRKAKKEAVKEFEMLKSEIQMQLDLM